MKFNIKLADCKPGCIFTEMGIEIPQTEAAEIWRLFSQKISFPPGAWLAAVEIKIGLMVAQDETTYLHAEKDSHEFH